MTKYLQGQYKCQNPKKYEGNANNIIYRSAWEFQVLRKLDTDPNVVKFSSEEIVIPYTDKATGKFHRYFPDFKVTLKNGKTYLIEVKPYAQTQEPVRGKKKHKTFLTEVMTWGKNQGKWEAARRFCEKKGWIFEIWTEKTMGFI